ncbi:EAL domain-containing protein [Planosporangium sp. 12N6]|uniref:putative bifunctional diguanylate cyclase/phosphodiesterase n=1 Tax=Planosporangium spinosum TaxID=3402278 RepID=UPI003CEE01EF
MRPGSRPAAPAWAFLACGGFAVGLYAYGPTALRPLLYLAVAVATIAATAVGARRHGSVAARRPWWAMAAAETAFLGGAILRLTVPGADATPPGPAALVPDLLVVPGYLCFAYGVVEMLRQRRRAADDDPARADALLIGLGAALAAWAYIIAPRIGSATVPTVPQVMAAFFPVVDVLLLVVVARLLFADGARKPSLWLIGSCAGAMFAGDLMYALREDGAGPSLLLFDVLILTAYLTMGAAALHPTSRTLTEPQQSTRRRLGVVRVGGIAAVLIAPAALAILSPPPTVWNGLVRLALSVLLTVTIVLRLVRANNFRAGAQRAAHHRATHDALTDLPNRELLTETIRRWCDRAVAGGQEISLLFIDLDRFKMVNDSWGHKVGDELLCAVAARLSAAVRDGDLVCRTGGDEFVILLAPPPVTDVLPAETTPVGPGPSPAPAEVASLAGPAGAASLAGPAGAASLAGPAGAAPPSARAEALARRLLRDFAEPFALSIGPVAITASIGVAHSDGAAGALELIRDADTAMYKAKSSGRNAYALFDRTLYERVRTRVELEQALRGALDRGELSVHYQPIVDPATDELSGFEALMRWRHPILGTVSPLAFIPIAEDTGLIVDSGAWLLEEAVEQLVRWRAARPGDLCPLHVSVNVSVRQLRDATLVDTVRRVLERTGLPASALWLEITESRVMEDPERAMATLYALRELGVTLCIDDFGTGYSSLTYLRRLPARIVKIDRSFLAGVGEDGDNEAIVRAVIALAHALGRQVVAEGVETVRQRDRLRALGCDLVQGWLYGAPRPAEAQLAWMDREVAEVPVGDGVIAP